MLRTLNQLIGLIAILHALLSSTGVAETPRLDTSHVCTFGDSLTDNDYLFTLFGTDPANYGVDPMEAFFAKAADGDDQLTNFAVLGSYSADVLAQVDFYVQQRKMGAIERASIVSVQAGGNDILDIVNNSANLFLLASAAPGESQDADQVIRDINSNLFRSYLKLRKPGRTKVILWTVPDVTLTPYYLSFGFSAAETENVRAHINRVNGLIRLLGLLRNTHVLDVNWILTESTFSPPVILGTIIQPTPAFGTPTDQFADPIHPTGVMNAIVANELIWQMNSRYQANIEMYSEVELAIIAGIGP